MSRRPNSRTVYSPNLGLYLGMPPLFVPERGLSDCINVRISQQSIEAGTLGWSPFPDTPSAVNLDGKPVLLIDQFVRRNAVNKLIFGNTTDLFEYDTANEVVLYITPRYETGTVDVTNGSPTVSGTSTVWTTNLKAGDFIFVGATGERDPTEAWYEIDTVDSDTQVTLTANYAGTTASGEAYTARSVFLGDLTTPFVTETFYSAVDVVGTDGDRWYATNGVDAVVGWDGTTDQVYRPTLGTIDTCAFIRRFKNVMIYGAIEDAGDAKRYSIRTSDTGKPEDVVNGDASEFLVHDGSDVLMTAAELGELLVLYSARHITLVQFVGPPIMFVFRTASTGFGPRSGQAVAEFPDHHLFIGPDSQYRFDGGVADYWNVHVWREVNRAMSPQRLDMIRAFFDEERGDLLWVVPLNSDADPDEGPPEIAYAHHYLERVGDSPDPHTRRELPATAFGTYQRETTLTWADLGDAWSETNFRWNDQFFQDAFPQVLFGTNDGDVFLLNTQASKNGTAMTAYARFGRRPLGGTVRKGILRRIYPFLQQLSASGLSVTVRVRTTDFPQGVASIAADGTYAVAQTADRNFVSFLAGGRFVEVEFRTEGQTDPWMLVGYDMDVVPGGEL